MNIVEELQHLSALEITPFLSRQLRLYGDANINEVIVPLRGYALELLSHVHNGVQSLSQKSAADLLLFCNMAIRDNAVPTRLQELIVGAWAGLSRVQQSRNAARAPRKSRRSPMEKKIIKFFKRERAKDNTLKEALASWEGNHIDGGLRLEYDAKNGYIVHDENATVPTSKAFTERQLKTMFSESS